MNLSEKGETPPKACRKGIKVSWAWIVVGAILIFVAGIWTGSNCLELLCDYVNGAKKQGSMAELGVAKIGEEDANTFLLSRMAFVTTGDKAPEAKYVDLHLNNLNLHEGGLGLAVAVSEDGYFLTAAHCIVEVGSHTLDSKVWIGGIIARGEPDLVPARLVWMSQEQDLALLRTSLELSQWFSVAEGLPDVGSPVIAGGLIRGPGGGQLLALQEMTSVDTTPIRLLHSAPAVRGDSGGPLIKVDGSLIGINYQRGYALNSFLMYNEVHATHIDQSWLHGLIEDDRDRFDGVGLD